MHSWRKASIPILLAGLSVPLWMPRSARSGNDNSKSTTTLQGNSVDFAITTAPNTTQSENSVFIHPISISTAQNSNNSTNWNGAAVTQIFGADDFRSTNGGSSWVGAIQGVAGTNGGDPAAAIALNGNHYVGFILNQGQGVARSTDGGQTWNRFQVAPNPGQLADKNHLWVDNSPSSSFSNRLYAAWTDFGGGNHGDVVLSRSTNNGSSWSAPMNISQGIAASFSQGVNLQTGPAGEVYAVWAIYDNPFPTDENAIGFARSSDGGASFGAPTTAITNIRGIRNTGTSKNMRVNSFPVMAVDISGGVHHGNIYVVWANIGTPGVNTGSEISVYLIRSMNGGGSWSSPIRVNQDLFANGNQHFFPWISCDPETGALSVVFYDDRNVGGTAVETFAAVSFDAGDTWHDFEVSDVSFVPGPIPGLAAGYFGDYLGIAARGQKVYPVWTDNRSGRALAYASPYETVPPTLTLQNRTVSTVRTYKAQNTITAGPAYTVASTSNLSLRSGAAITLKPGFTASMGARFSAVIDGSLISSSPVRLVASSAHNDSDR